MLCAYFHFMENGNDDDNYISNTQIRLDDNQMRMQIVHIRLFRIFGIRHHFQQSYTQDPTCITSFCYFSLSTATMRQVQSEGREQKTNILGVLFAHALFTVQHSVDLCFLVHYKMENVECDINMFLRLEIINLKPKNLKLSYVLNIIQCF